MAMKWERNPLFRLLAFLDVVGLQPFSVARDLHSDGRFVNAERTTGGVVRAILHCGLHTLRSNITRLFTDEEEREKLLELVGRPDDGPNSASLSYGILSPASLHTLEETIENGLPIWASVRIKEAFGFSSSKSDGGSLLMVEQFLIDALDDWMGTRSHQDNDTLVLACGVQPRVLECVRDKAEEFPHAVEDFIIDVVFPPTYDNSMQVNNPVVDWLVVSYCKCHSAMSGDDAQSMGEEAVRSTCVTPMKYEMAEEGNEDGEMLLTEANLNAFMRERPSAVPKVVLREVRRPLNDPAITEFELQNHYLASELVKYVKDIKGPRKQYPKKSNCIRIILEHHQKMGVHPPSPKRRRKEK
ncbi:hypothetical protein TRVL_00596 [Trypanosoma vivax]|nr:hypothetical protein TRVL_00596 [Trypanosoma vivax]